MPQRPRRRPYRKTSNKNADRNSIVMVINGISNCFANAQEKRVGHNKTAPRTQ